MDPLFFHSAKELRTWLKKNSSRKTHTEVWLQLTKKVFNKEGLSSREVSDEALCFGWVPIIIKKIDLMSYKIKLVRRKPKKRWSAGNIQRFKELMTEGRVQAAGLKVFKERDRTGPEERPIRLSPNLLKKIKSNKKAWSFFESQTASYQKYMILWVMGAKRTETQEARLKMLIEDSAKGTKLQRILKAQETIKKRLSPPGKTPIEQARNLGPVTALDLKGVGFETLEQLKSVGWERAFIRLIEIFPHRLNLNMLYALIGAVEDQHWRSLDPDLKGQAQQLVRELKVGR